MKYILPMYAIRSAIKFNEIANSCVPMYVYLLIKLEKFYLNGNSNNEV